MKRQPACPVCSAEILLSGEEVAGEEVFCAYCGTPMRLTASAGSEDVDVEEDY